MAAVFLFDYDAVEKLTDVKIRTNMDREPGEETVPGWVFEDGVVFLPEELEHGMQLMNRYARRCFREENLGSTERRILAGRAAETSSRRGPPVADVSRQLQARHRPW